MSPKTRSSRQDPGAAWAAPSCIQRRETGVFTEHLEVKSPGPRPLGLQDELFEKGGAAGAGSAVGLVVHRWLRVTVPTKRRRTIGKTKILAVKRAWPGMAKTAQPCGFWFAMDASRMVTHPQLRPIRHNKDLSVVFFPRHRSADFAAARRPNGRLTAVLASRRISVR